MPAAGGDFWVAIVQDLRDASPGGYATLLATYPDGAGRVDLHRSLISSRFMSLATHRGLGDLRLPTFWLSRSSSTWLCTRSSRLGGRRVSVARGASNHGSGKSRACRSDRAEGYSTLEELHAHYTGSDDSMSALNYVWFQYRWLRLAAKMFEVDREGGLVRFWDRFHATDRVNTGATAASLAPLLTAEAQPHLGRAAQDSHPTQPRSHDPSLPRGTPDDQDRSSRSAPSPREHTRPTDAPSGGCRVSLRPCQKVITATGHLVTNRRSGSWWHRVLRIDRSAGGPWGLFHIRSRSPTAGPAAMNRVQRDVVNA